MLIPFIRTLILYLLIVIALRFMGKRQIGEMQPSELVVTILISAVASVPMQDINIPLSHGVVPILTLIAAEIIISAISLSSLRFRKILTGSPVPIIHNGTIDQGALKRLRLDSDDVLEGLRLKNVFDLRQVEFAQVETNGQLSILVNTLDSTATPRMMGLSPQIESPFYVIINDGKLITTALKEVGKSREWVTHILKANGVNCPAEAYLLCVDKYSNIIFAKKEKK